MQLRLRQPIYVGCWLVMGLTAGILAAGLGHPLIDVTFAVLVILTQAAGVVAVMTVLARRRGQEG